MATQNLTWSDTLHEITVGGIDFETMDGYGGLKCKEYSSIDRRILESCLYLFISLISISVSVKLNPYSAFSGKKSGEQCNEKTFQNGVRHHKNRTNNYNESLRTIVLFIYTLVNGIELGYKVMILLDCNKLFQENSNIIDILLFHIIINCLIS